MEKKLALVVIRTRQFETMKEFYENKLGLQLRLYDQASKWCHFKAGGIELGVQEAKDSEEPSTPSSIYVCFQLTDIDAAVIDMRNRGVNFTSDIKENREEGFRQITAADPDGNKIVFFQYSSFPSKAA